MRLYDVICNMYNVSNRPQRDLVWSALVRSVYPKVLGRAISILST